MVSITMYSSAGCGYCQSAEHLLKRKGVTRINKILIDQVPGARETMTHKTGRRTVPQIYVGELHVGGFDELAALERAGRLDALLGQ
ncbi:MAG: glutaredoxin 3 [Rhodoferax sp.]|uniref:glutaredoxin 3 n=1 Tax=Rhodoferax sp. TaxID=50421 RepID=UPI0027375739|nr:glutaredoxin 3 [Rhodoferax sp.]MDP2679651.1 glutaredoxin 3 [Rhodoferax sp.]